MNFIGSLKDLFLEFIFPKSSSLENLEKLSISELLKVLEKPEDLKDPNTTAIFSYKDRVMREIIWEIKYHNNKILTERMSHILLDVLKAEIAERALFDNFSNPILIPIPIGNKRKNERGYNQTEIICKSLENIDKNYTFRLGFNILLKVRDTISQTEAKTKSERLKNLSNTMGVSNKELIKDKNIILLDDVTTTGATFEEAKRALRQAGAKKILCIALAH